jgi:hypothetical protein
MSNTVEIVLYENEQDYRQHYENIFADVEYVLKGLPVRYDKKSFDHIFSEPGADSCRQFSKRRAKKMMFMKAMLMEHVKTEIMFENDTQNFAIFCDDLDCVMYLALIKKEYFQVRTFFDFGKDHSKMCKKQKNKCKAISDVEFNEMIKK